MSPVTLAHRGRVPPLTDISSDISQSGHETIFAAQPRVPGYHSHHAYLSVICTTLLELVWCYFLFSSACRHRTDSNAQGSPNNAADNINQGEIPHHILTPPASSESDLSTPLYDVAEPSIPAMTTKVIQMARVVALASSRWTEMSV